MMTILLIACVGFITGAFLLLGLSPLEFTNGLFGFLTRKNRSIKAEINEEAWETLYSAVSHPFKEPASGKIAVKVINHLATYLLIAGYGLLLAAVYIL